MKVVIHPNYSHLAHFIRSIPHGYTSDGILRDARNKIDKVVVDPQTTLVVKRFATPGLLRRLIYTVSWSKARRSYKYALRLNKIGISTPEPVAYIETREGGLFHTGYYIYQYITWDLLDRIEDFCDIKSRQELVDDFAAFTAAMHMKNVSHHDYNPKNIFFRKACEGGHYEFSLIDINRMRFSRPSKRECMKELTRLKLSLPTLVAITARYATIRGWNPEKLCGYLLLDRGYNLRSRTKKFFKKLIGRK